jgi:PPOX class probable F420-dependent enzyme
MANTIQVPESLTDLLNGPNTAVLTTVGADGLPQSTAVWYLVGDDGILRTSITTDRQKYRNLVRHPKATLFILDPTNPYRTIEIRANVELTPDPDKAMLPLFAEKYGVPVEVLQQAGGDRVVATFDPVKVNANG